MLLKLWFERTDAHTSRRTNTQRQSYKFVLKNFLEYNNVWNLLIIDPPNSVDRQKKCEKRKQEVDHDDRPHVLDSGPLQKFWKNSTKSIKSLRIQWDSSELHPTKTRASIQQVRTARKTRKTTADRQNFTTINRPCASLLYSCGILLSTYVAF